MAVGQWDCGRFGTQGVALGYVEGGLWPNRGVMLRGGRWPNRGGVLLSLANGMFGDDDG